MERPTIAITMGDPAGVGPEVVIKALNSPDLYEICRPVAVGVEEGLKRAIRLLGGLEKREDSGGVGKV